VLVLNLVKLAGQVPYCLIRNFLNIYLLRLTYSADPNYPSGGIGSYTNRLKLSWLEYVSATDVISGTSSPAGWLDFRGAQKIDLKPGFHAEHGSFFLAHIKDYNCSGGDIGDGPYNFAELNPTALRPGHSDTGVVDTGWREIVYLPNGDGYKADPLPIADTGGVDNSESEILNNMDYYKNLYKDSIIDFYTKIKESPELQSLLGISADSADQEMNKLFPDFITVDVYPNPTQGKTNLTYTMSTAAEVNIILTNTVGQDLSFLIDTYDKYAQPGKHIVMINTDRAVPGLYYVEIKIGNKIISKKVAVIN
jgi:hypothetical protein